MFCPNCGNKVPDGWKYCNVCGSPIPLPSRLVTNQKREAERFTKPSMNQEEGEYDTKPSHKKRNVAITLVTLCFILLIVGTGIVHVSFFLPTPKANSEVTQQAITTSAYSISSAVQASTSSSSEDFEFQADQVVYELPLEAYWFINVTNERDVGIVQITASIDSSGCSGYCESSFVQNGVTWYSSTAFLYGTEPVSSSNQVPFGQTAFDVPTIEANTESQTFNVRVTVQYADGVTSTENDVPTVIPLPTTQSTQSVYDGSYEIVSNYCGVGGIPVEVQIGVWQCHAWQNPVYDSYSDCQVGLELDYSNYSGPPIPEGFSCVPS